MFCDVCQSTPRPPPCYTFTQKRVSQTSAPRLRRWRQADFRNPLLEWDTWGRTDMDLVVNGWEWEIQRGAVLTKLWLLQVCIPRFPSLGVFLSWASCPQKKWTGMQFSKHLEPAVSVSFIQHANPKYRGTPCSGFFPQNLHHLCISIFYGLRGIPQFPKIVGAKLKCLANNAFVCQSSHLFLSCNHC